MNSEPKVPERRRLKPATQARRQELHDRLVVAAEAAIEGAGLATLRARTLAEAVGCSIGAIYQVFPDLDALVLAVNGRTLEAIDAAMGGAGPERPPGEHMMRLADTYLDYAAANRPRWTALFQHRMPPGSAVPEDYARKQAAAFRHIEHPLGLLRPDMTDEQRSILARSLFSAVHGMVALGLDEKVAAMPMPVLRVQIRLVVAALAKGLARG